MNPILHSTLLEDVPSSLIHEHANDDELLDPNTSYFEYYTRIKKQPFTCSKESAHYRQHRGCDDLLSHRIPLQLFNNDRLKDGNEVFTSTIYDSMVTTKLMEKERHINAYQNVVNEMAADRLFMSKTSNSLMSLYNNFHDESLLIKGRFFKKWKIAAKRRILAEKDQKKKLYIAKQFQRLQRLKEYFKQWRLVSILKGVSAVALSEVHLLRKCFYALKTVTDKTIDNIKHIQKRSHNKNLRQHLNIWKARHFYQKCHLLKSLFCHWKHKTRLRMIQKEVNQSLFSSQYYNLKEEHRLQQQRSIAFIHFKLNLLSKKFHCWRLFTIQNRIVKRTTDVARIHYEDNVLASIFQTWKEKTLQKKVLMNKLNLYTTASVFRRWKKQTQLAKISRHQQYLVARTFYHQIVCRRSLNMWKQKFQQKLANDFCQQNQMRCTFNLWHLQMLRRQLQRRLSRAHCRKIIQKRMFFKWKSKLDEKSQNRVIFLKKLNLIFLGHFLQKWKYFVGKRHTLRTAEICITEIHRKNILLSFYCTWKHKIVIQDFISHHQIWHKRYLARKYFILWKGKVKRKRLLQLMPTWSLIQNRIILKAQMSIWKKRKLVKYQRRQIVIELEAKSINWILSTYLHTWRLAAREQLLIKPYMLHHNHVATARCFDAWSTFVFKKKNIHAHLRSIKLKKIRKSFVKWNYQTKAILEKKRLMLAKQNKILLKVIRQWIDYAKLSKQHRDTTLACLARHWLDRTQQRMLNQEILKAEQANVEISKRVYFTKWFYCYQLAKTKRVEMEEKADKYSIRQTLFNSYICWKRQYEIQMCIRVYIDGKKQSFLRKVLKCWHGYIVDEINASTQAFNENVNLFVPPNHRGYRHSAPCLNSTIKEFNDRQKGKNDYGGTLSFISESSNFVTGDPSSIKRQDICFYGDEETSTSIKDIESPSSPSLVTHRSSEVPEASWSETQVLASQEFTYDSDYEMDAHWTEISLEDTQSKGIISMNETFSESEWLNGKNEPLSLSLPVWIQNWKNRLKQSKDDAIVRRLSHTIDVKSLDYNRKKSVIERYSVESHRFIPALPEVPEILNRSLLFLNDSKDETTVHTSGIHSFDVDDEQLSTTSCFTEMSVQSRQQLLVRTIHHWKSLDVSRTFYHWYKYTQHKKYLRDMYEYLIEKKSTYIAHASFLKWNRSLYCVQVSREFQCRRFLTRGWRSLKYNVQKEKLKYAREVQVSTFYRNWRFRTTFTAWVRKLHSNENITGILQVWRSATRTKTIHLSPMNALLNARKLKILKSSFKWWLDQTNKVDEARNYYHQALLSKCVNVWWMLILIKERRLARLKRFQLEHQIFKAFEYWKRKHYCRQQIKRHSMEKTNDLVRVIFLAWNAWTQEKFHKQRKEFVYKRKYEYQLLMDSFIEWKLCHQQLCYGMQHHQAVLLRKIFISWKNYNHLLFVNKKKCQEIEEARSLSILLHSFQRWRDIFEARREEKLQDRLKKGNLLSVTFKTWRSVTMKHKADFYLQKCNFTRYFEKWKSSLVYQRKEILLKKKVVRIWIQFTKRNLINQSNLQKLVETKNMILISESFTEWKKQFENVRLSRSHRELYIFKKYYYSWYVTVQKQTHHKRCKDVFMMERSINLLRSSFTKWKSRSLTRKQLTVVNTTKASKYHHMAITKMYFHMWKRKLGIQKLITKRINRISFKYYSIWLEMTTTNKIVAEMYRGKICEMFWMKWRRAYIQSRVMDSMKRKDEGRILTETFGTWLHYTQVRKKCL